ncbi:hypothetical protein LX32DRAFT_701272 [Colletotrichum zoysiae]|uniref:Uncharacterized protein n=1 Tax=Colletotrichum zoysiae TaxID=1216348 RepID=A0AAD9HEL4_9PEZI|nr:hypothetical protein LX32DRAFT_701272 [Colletotrichum zoysiae]
MAIDAPPSYESIISKIDASVKTDPSFNVLQKTLDGLPEDEKAILISMSNNTKTLNLDPTQEKKFREGFAQGFSQAASHLEWNAEQSAKLCNKTEMTLIDDTGFDTVIVPFASGPTYPVEKKKDKIAEFIKEAEDLETKAAGIHKDFSDFLTELTTYTSRFDVWASKKEGDLTGQIKRLNDEIADLQKELAKLATAMFAVGGVAGVALPALAVGAACAGPFAPLVIGIGIFFALGTVGSITGMAFRSSAIKKEIEAKETEKKNLNTQLQAIQQSRSELKALGVTLANDVANVVGVINTAWKYCQDDAVEIKKWLESGAKDTDIPEYMALELGKADGIYSVVGKYLKKYADTLADATKV